MEMGLWAQLCFGEAFVQDTGYQQVEPYLQNDKEHADAHRKHAFGAQQHRYHLGDKQHPGDHGRGGEGFAAAASQSGDTQRKEQAAQPVGEQIHAADVDKEGGKEGAQSQARGGYVS